MNVVLRKAPTQETFGSNGNGEYPTLYFVRDSFKTSTTYIVFHDNGCVDFNQLQQAPSKVTKTRLPCRL